MKPAIDDAKGARLAPVRILLLVTAASALFETGCASSAAWRASAGALAGSLWDRSRNDPPTYDLYAQTMSGARGPSSTRPALAAKESPGSKGAAEPAAEPIAEKVAPAEPAEPIAAAAPVETDAPSARPARTDDKVRITLGRPESLPVLTESGESTAPSLAAAAPRPSSPAPRKRAAAPSRRREAEPEASAAAPAIASAPSRPAPSKPKDPDQKLRTILEEAKDRLEKMSTYQVNITRSERVGSQVQPQEEVLLSVRRNPKAVRLEWPTGSSKGREVIYSTSINDKMMYVNMADSALPIPRMTIPIDSPLALRNSRHSINEAGFDTIFDNLFKQLPVVGGPEPEGGRLVYKGLSKPRDVDLSCHLIERTTPTKDVWKVFLDVKSLMPVVVTAHAEDGSLLESYIYTKLQPNPGPLASADAFDPDKRWGESKGLFSRLAKAAQDAQASPPTTTR